jgi:hypothetical protein
MAASTKKLLRNFLGTVRFRGYPAASGVYEDQAEEEEGTRKEGGKEARRRRRRCDDSSTFCEDAHTYA